MPWKETHAVSERHHLVDLVVHNGIAISQAARSLGISRKTAHKWLARYDKRGRDALTDQSRARHTQSHLHPALAGADVSNALQQFVEEIRVAFARRILEALIVHRKALQKIFTQARRCPLAELSATGTAHSIADRENGGQAVVATVA